VHLVDFIIRMNTINFILSSIMRPHSKTRRVTVPRIRWFVEGYTQFYTIIEINKKNRFNCSI